MHKILIVDQARNKGNCGQSSDPKGNNWVLFPKKVFTIWRQQESKNVSRSIVEGPKARLERDMDDEPVSGTYRFNCNKMS